MAMSASASPHQPGSRHSRHPEDTYPLSPLPPRRGPLLSTGRGCKPVRADRPQAGCWRTSAVARCRARVAPAADRRDPTGQRGTAPRLGSAAVDTPHDVRGSSRGKISGPAGRNRLIFLSIGHAHGRIWRCRTAKTSVRSARYRPAGEVPSVTYPSGTHVVFTAPGSASSGQYGLFEWNLTSSPACPARRCRRRR